MSRWTYTSEQIHQLYDRIHLPEKWRCEPGGVRNLSFGYHNQLALLTILQRHMLAHVPFENLELHYSRTKTIDIHPEIIFQKIVGRKSGRGGYCMENNTFFITLCRSLGFQVYSTAARINSAISPNGDLVHGDSFYYGFAHMVNIVRIQEELYLVDVGFGAGGLVKPIALRDGNLQQNLDGCDNFVQVRYGTIPDNESNLGMWILERSISGDTGPWSALYAFSSYVEFLPADFSVANHFTSTSRTSFFTHNLMVVKYLLSEDGCRIIGEQVLIGGKLRQSFGKKRLVTEVKDEVARVALLEEEFGIRLDDMERSGILGLGSMLGDD